ncbi:AsnC family transcriptional regulator [Cryobacterium melibiosiphilum]|uniref:AsnC family transcriptional regulator n=1 Tax=Cryobacterium melibiosiphilum TaxID=995039 RepID=A0A3A5MSS0_9MICO|nr:Lrp/AsnC ligand binding domain-containing protein [Cryobacterium melibiosiphilum]RJT88976.1 AsnC family transcriptional regulator [Cryobacterium melibiosiphilum]
MQLDELDRQVIHALQIWPRAPWTFIGEVLGVDPMTASRRWQVMEDNGSAWISVSDVIAAESLRAIIDIRVKSSRLPDALLALEADPSVRTLRSVLGDWSISLDWQGHDIVALDAYLTGTLTRLKGVIATRTHIVTGVLLEGSAWRLRALSQEQVSTLMHAASFDDVASPSHEVHEIDEQVLRNVTLDGRATLTSLAERMTTSVATVRRHLNHMISSRALVMRCDVARPLSGWPIAAHFMCTVDPRQIAEVGEALSRIREIRAAQVLVGPYNLCLNFWVRSLPEITALEAHLARNIPQIRIGERSVTSNMLKHMQVSLRGDGRRTAVVGGAAA